MLQVHWRACYVSLAKKFKRNIGQLQLHRSDQNKNNQVYVTNEGSVSSWRVSSPFFAGRVDNFIKKFVTFWYYIIVGAMLLTIFNTVTNNTTNATRHLDHNQSMFLKTVEIYVF